MATEAGIRSRSILISVLVHGLLFLILLFTVMSTPIPPFPETGGGGGVIVNIGYVDEASGEVQPMSPNTTEDPNLSASVPVPSPDEQFATQEIEESPIAKEKPDPAKTIPKTPRETTPKTQPVKTEPVRVVDSRALYKGPKTGTGNQGTGQGNGDQGDPTGDPNSKYYGKGSGTGGGEGGGDGKGTGGGKGDGFSFDLAGRRMTRKPQVNDRSQETGKVVVEITVDKNGHVTSAIPGGRGSTTTSSYLYRLAKEAAMKAEFSPSPDGADIQKGTMTFIFLVQ